MKIAWKCLKFYFSSSMGLFCDPIFIKYNLGLRYYNRAPFFNLQKNWRVHFYRPACPPTTRWPYRNFFFFFGKWLVAGKGGVPRAGISLLVVSQGISPDFPTRSPLSHGCKGKALGAVMIAENLQEAAAVVDRFCRNFKGMGRGFAEATRFVHKLFGFGVIVLGVVFFHSLYLLIYNLM